MIGLNTFTCGNSAKDCSLRLLRIELISKVITIVLRLWNYQGLSTVVIIIVAFIFIGVTILAFIGIYKSIPELLLPFILMQWIAVLLFVLSMIGMVIYFFYKSANAKSEEDLMVGDKKNIPLIGVIILVETVIAIALMWYLYLGIIFLSFYKTMIKDEVQRDNSMRN